MAYKTCLINFLKSRPIEEKFFFSCRNGEVEVVKAIFNQLKFPKELEVPYSKAPFILYFQLESILDFDVNSTKRYGKTPFYIACQQGHIEIVKLLLNDNRVDVNRGFENYRATPFSIACQQGHIEIVKLLLNDKRVDINKARDDGSTPFLIACYNGYIDIVKLLLNDQRVDPNKPTNSRITPLHIVCQNGNIEIVKLLLNDERVEIEKTDNLDFSPFFYACLKGCIEIVKLFLNNERFDINKVYGDGWTPFYEICGIGLIEIVEYVLANGREVVLNIGKKDEESVISLVRIRGNQEKRDWESEENFQNRKRSHGMIVKLLELFERNPNETRFKLRKLQGILGKIF